MQVKNIGQRAWNVGGKLVIPGKTEECECTEADIAGNVELEMVATEAKTKDEGMTKAEIVEALKAKGVKFDISNKKEDLQVLLDGAK